MGIKTDAAGSGQIPMKASAAEAFEALFVQHWDRIYQVLFRMVGDPAEAEDLALEVFWRLYEHSPEENPGTNVAGWLYRVATNLGYNALRAGRRRAFYEGAAADLHSSQTRDMTAAEAERRMERSRVRKVLQAMKPRAAKILILRHSGLAYSEIAAAMGLADSSVGTILSRAQREFAERFAASEGAHDGAY